MKFYETDVPVRFYEVDAFGVVWHGHYACYLEIGRLYLSEKLGLSLDEMRRMGVYAPLVELKIKYKAFARFGDVLVVKTGILPTEKASLTFKYIIERKSDAALIAEAETTHVLLTLDGKMLYQAPEGLKKMLDDYFAG